MKKLALVLLIVAALFIVVYVANRPTTTQTRSGSVDLSSAPTSHGVDFALENLYGKTIRLSDYQGKHVLLVFFATWCHPCKMEIPHLNKLHGNNVVEVVAVNLQESQRKVNQFVESQRISYPVLLDERGTVQRQFSVRQIPTSLLINPDGSIHKRIAGFDPAIEKLVTRWARSG